MVSMFFSLLMVVVVLVIAHLTPLGHDLLTRTGLLNTASIMGRFDENQHAFIYLNLSNLFIGLGFNHYRLQPGAASDFIHNDWLGFLVEGGVLALGLMLILANQSKRYLASEPRHARAFAIFIFILSMVDFPLRSPSFLATLTLLFFTSFKPQSDCARRRTTHVLDNE